MGAGFSGFSGAGAAAGQADGPGHETDEAAGRRMLALGLASVSAAAERQAAQRALDRNRVCTRLLWLDDEQVLLGGTRAGTVAWSPVWDPTTS